MRRNVLKTLTTRYRSSVDLGHDPALSRTGLDAQVPVVVGQTP
jgi:hypothetical protein